MALRFPARVKATSTTTGTGSLTLTEAGSVGWRTFTRAVTDLDLADGDQVPFITVDTTITNGPKLLEVAVGTWNNSTKVLTRDTIYQPNATPVSWGTGTRDVVVIDNPAMFLLLAGGTMTGLLKILLSGSIISPAAETSLVVQRSASTSTDCGVSIISGTAAKSCLNLGDTANEKVGGVCYNNSTDALTFRSNNTDRQVVDNAGVLRTVAGGTPYDAFPGSAATVLVFYQAAAPTGWTKVTTQNDKALRVVSGTGGVAGGTRPLSMGRTEDTSLTVAQIPAHSHLLTKVSSAQSGITAQVPTDYSTTPTATTSETGGGDPHFHTLALAYIDVIICSKN